MIQIHSQEQGRKHNGTFIGALSLVIALCGVGLAGLAGASAVGERPAHKCSGPITKQ